MRWCAVALLLAFVSAPAVLGKLSGTLTISTCVITFSSPQAPPPHLPSVSVTSNTLDCTPAAVAALFQLYYTLSVDGASSMAVTGWWRALLECFGCSKPRQAVCLNKIHKIHQLQLMPGHLLVATMIRVLDLQVPDHASLLYLMHHLCLAQLTVQTLWGTLRNRNGKRKAASQRLYFMLMSSMDVFKVSKPSMEQQLLH